VLGVRGSPYLESSPKGRTIAPKKEREGCAYPREGKRHHEGGDLRLRKAIICVVGNLRTLRSKKTQNREKKKEREKQTRSRKKWPGFKVGRRIFSKIAKASLEC